MQNLKNHLATLLVLLFSFGNAQAPSWQWVKGGTGYLSSYGCKIASDASGNVYTIGRFIYTGMVIDSYTLANVSTQNAFIVKYDALGNAVWAQSLDKEAFLTDISSDASGNIILTGFSGYSLSVGGYTLAPDSVFTIKYNPAGTVLWARSSVPAFLSANNCIDANGNVYVTGTFQNTCTVGAYTLSSDGDSEVFLLKYDSSGNLLWATTVGSSGPDNMYDITSDAFNNVFITGGFPNTTLSFGTTTLAGNNQQNLFIVKYDASGNAVWAKNPDGNFSGSDARLAADPSGNIYITGSFSSPLSLGTTTLTPSSLVNYDCFILKYTGAGNVAWARSWGGTGSEYVWGVSADPQGNAVVTGGFDKSPMTIGTITLTSTGTNNDDIYVAKYDPNGNVAWAISTGGSYSEYATDIDATYPGNLFISGSYFDGPGAIGPYAFTNQITSLPPAYGPAPGFYVAKLGSNFVGIHENTGYENSFAVYPNPSHGLCYLSGGNSAEIQSVNVYNALGMEVSNVISRHADGWQINLSAEPHGIYFIRVKTEQAIETKKIIID